MNKRLFLAAVLVSWTLLNSWAQSTITFTNANPVYGPETPDPTVSKVGNSPPEVYTGALLAGSSYCAQLFAAPGSITTESLLGAMAPVTTFRTGTRAGYVAPVSVSLPLAPGTSATFQFRVWDNSSGLFPTWSAAEAAWSSGQIAAGKSMLWTEALLGTPPSPEPIVAVPSFNIYIVPEPGSAALMVLGALAFVVPRLRPR